MSQQEKWSMNVKQCPLANSSVTSLTVLSFQLLIGILCAVAFCSISYFSTCLCTISLLKKILSCRVNFQGIFYSPVFYSARSTLSYIHFTRFIYCLYDFMCEPWIQEPWITWNWSYGACELPCGFWDPNLCPQKEQFLEVVFSPLLGSTLTV